MSYRNNVQSYGMHESPTASNSTNGRSGGYDRSSSSRRPSFQAPAPLNPVIIEIPKKLIDPTSTDLISFKDHHYSVEMLRKQSGPDIEINAADLHPDFLSMVKPSRELPEDVLNVSPVFAKYEGKYVVVLGVKAIIEKSNNGQTVLKGKLLSNPVLKKCVVDVVQ